MFCRFCGSQLREGAKFCTQCGKQIVASNPAPTATPIPEQKTIYTAPEAPAQPAPEVQYTPEPKVQPEPATPVADPAPKYEAPAAYTAPAYTAEPSVPADKKAKKVKKEGKKSKKGLVITLIILAILAVAAAAYFIFFGNKIEISDEAIAAIYEDTGIENAEDVIKIVSAKVMSTETATLMGVDMKDEHVRLKAETEFAEVEFCYVISYSNYSGEWHVEYVKEYYGEDCGHGGNVVHVKKVLTKEQVEADIREYFEDADMVCTNVVIPENPKNAIEGIDVTLTVNGEIYGSIMWANVTVHYQPDATKGWGIRYANYEEIDKPADGGADDGSDIEELPDADTEGTPSTNPDGTTDRVPDPDQPVSDEKVIEDLTRYDGNYTNVEILKSGYNYDGSYSFSVLATSEEYLPFTVEFLYEKTYYKDSNGHWSYGTTSYHIYSFESIDPLLGTWKGSYDSTALTLAINDIRFEASPYGYNDVIISYDLNINGSTKSEETHIYGIYASYDYINIPLAGYTSDHTYFSYEYRMYASDSDGKSGWYINDTLLTKVEDSSQPEQSGQTTADFDITGTWARYDLFYNDESEYLIRAYTFDDINNAFEINFRALLEANGLRENGYYKEVGSYFLYGNTSPKYLTLWSYNNEYNLSDLQNYRSSLEDYMILDYKKGVSFVIQEDSANGNAVRLYYCGDIEPSEISLYDLMLMQGDDVSYLDLYN